MDILAKSDSEILEIADPIWGDMIQGSNEKNWGLFSKYMPENRKSDEKRINIEKQWDKSDVLTSLTTKREFLNILRKSDTVVVLWRQWSTNVEGELLAMLYFQSIDNEVKVKGNWII